MTLKYKALQGLKVFNNFTQFIIYIYIFLIGLSFRRVGSCKIFAVTQDLSRFGGKEKGRADKRKRDTIELSSSDYDNEPQMKKKFIAKLDEVLEEMKYLRRNVIDVMKLMKGIFSSLQDLTQC